MCVFFMLLYVMFRLKCFTKKMRSWWTSRDMVDGAGVDSAHPQYKHTEFWIQYNNKIVDTIIKMLLR